MSYLIILYLINYVFTGPVCKCRVSISVNRLGGVYSPAHVICIWVETSVVLSGSFHLSFLLPRTFLLSRFWVLFSLMMIIVHACVCMWMCVCVFVCHCVCEHQRTTIRSQFSQLYMVRVIRFTFSFLKVNYRSSSYLPVLGQICKKLYFKLTFNFLLHYII